MFKLQVGWEHLQSSGRWREKGCDCKASQKCRDVMKGDVAEVRDAGRAEAIRIFVQRCQ